jgi:hypothetical protein
LMLTLNFATVLEKWVSDVTRVCNPVWIGKKYSRKMKIN